jgi:hypothetical protein
MQVTRVPRVPAAAVIGIAALMLTAAATACGGDTPGPNPTVVATTTSSTPAITPPVIESRISLTEREFGFPSLTIADLLRVYPTVVVGRVEQVLQPFDPRAGFLGYSQSQIEALEASPKGGPIPPDMLARPPGSMSSIYAVRVLANVVGEGPRPDGMFALMQPGGVFESVAYENGGDPIVLLGSTYLFFLTPLLIRASNYTLPDGYEELPEEYQQPYISSAEARFLVVDGQLEAIGPESGDDCSQCEDHSLVGRTLYETVRFIRDRQSEPEASAHGARSSLRESSIR